jgi:hypothetical protein
MIRRNARLRKEYLYRKSLEGKEKAAYERKRLIRKALDGEPSGRLLGLVHAQTAALAGSCRALPANKRWKTACSRLHGLVYCIMQHQLL